MTYDQFHFTKHMATIFNFNNALIGFDWSLLELTGFEDCKELDS